MTSNFTYAVADGSYSISPACDTAYSAGDVLFDRTELLTTQNAFYVTTLKIVDPSDNTAFDMELWFLNADVTLGTKNAAPSISDGDAAAYLCGKISIAAADWKDLGASKVVSLTTASFGALRIMPGSTGKIYLAAYTPTGTPGFESAPTFVIQAEPA